MPASGSCSGGRLDSYPNMFFLPDPESELTFTPRRGGNSVALEGLDPEPYFSEIRIRRKTIGSLAPGVYINIHTTYAK